MFCFTGNFRLKFVGTGSVSSIISSHVITKSSIMLSKYLLFLQIHVAGFQIDSFSYTPCVFAFSHSHQDLSLFQFWFELHFLPSNLHLHSCDKALSMLFIRLFI